MNEIPSQMRKIAVIGATAAGMSAAYALGTNGCHVTLYDGQHETGGMIRKMSIGSERLDCFLLQILPHDEAVLKLIDDVDIRHRLMWYPSFQGLYMAEQVHPFASLLNLLCLHPVHPVARLRIAWLLAKIASGIRPKQLIQMNVLQWILPRIGTTAYEQLIRPLLQTRFDADADFIAAEWLFEQITAAIHQGLRTSHTVGYLDGGFHSLFDTIRNTLIENGHRIVTTATISDIIQKDSGQLEVITTEDSDTFDQILFAGSPMQLMGLKSPLSQISNRMKSRTPYKGLISVVLELDKPLSPHCNVTIIDESIPFSQITGHTNWVGLRGYGSHVVYLTAYTDTESSLWHETDELLLQLFLDALPRVFPMFSLSILRKASVFRAPYAQPVVRVGYKESATFETEVPGFFKVSHTGSMQDYSLNEAVALGNAVADSMLRSREALL